MTDKNHLFLSKRNIVRIIFLFSLIALLSFGSFYRSKYTALELVGETIKDYPLSRAKITILLGDKIMVVWDFKFSLPGSFDEEFYVYTSLWGSIYETNPRDLESRLRKEEKLREK